MRGSILHIKKNTDRTISFHYRAPLPLPDAISEVSADQCDQPAYYDLSGRQVRQPGRGLYIVGGKKVVVR